MKKIQFGVSLIVAAILVFLLADKFSSNKEEYPLENEVQEITEEFFLYYLANKTYPTSRNFLSKRTLNLIRAYPENFRWDENGMFLHFTPRASANLKSITIGEPGNNFKHNAKVYSVHAIWSEGFKDHYFASPEELDKAGVKLPSS
jgi:hypothetical protein